MRTDAAGQPKQECWSVELTVSLGRVHGSVSAMIIFLRPDGNGDAADDTMCHGYCERFVSPKLTTENVLISLLAASRLARWLHYLG